MHVLIIAQYFPPDLGGSATRAYNVAKGLMANDVDVTVLTAFPHYPMGNIPKKYSGKLFTIEYMDSIKIIRGFILPLESKGFLNRLLLFSIFIFFSIFGLVITRGSDVIWVANPDIFGMIPALFCKMLFHTPIAFNIDDLSMEDVENLKLMRKESLLFKTAKLVTRLLYAQADAFTPISPGYVPFIKTYGVSDTRITVIRGGVDLDTFKPVENVIHGQKFRILYSGSFSVAYDFDQILNAAKILNEKDPQIEFIIQGKGELSSRLKKRINELHLSNLRLIDKFFTREVIAYLLNSADVLILPLKDFGVPYPGISSKLYEYQAIGKPIICCSVGASAEYILQTSSGVVVKPGDVNKLIDSILFLKYNSDQRLLMGNSGRSYVYNNVSLNHIGIQMKQLLGYLCFTV